MGTDVDIRLELDATAAKGILDRQGISKVRHIDVNCLWLQEQCAKKMVPLSKVPGEDNTADLMTKHLAAAVITRHTDKLNLKHEKGRSDIAAQLHMINEKMNEHKMIPNDYIDEPDFWAERGEEGRWVRIHTTPRRAMFDPWEAARGPGRKTRLQSVRTTKGRYVDGGAFEQHDRWQERVEDEGREWKGATLFLVDKTYSKDYGTDQRRQRSAARNKRKEMAPRRVSWADTSGSEG